MSDLFLLSSAQMRRIEPFFPRSHGVPRVDDRRVNPTRTRHGFGRATMPETTAYSTVMTVRTLWLAARAVGLGMGWVSILDPTIVAAALEVPAGWTFIGYLCLGYPQAENDTPELERAFDGLWARAGFDAEKHAGHFFV